MVDVTNLDTYPVWYSFCIAMLMGVTHVVLGPDHVSALVLLVAGVKRHEQICDTTNKWQLCKKSAMQGFRWGLGHTIGLTFMTAIFMIFKLLCLKPKANIRAGTSTNPITSNRYQ